ncbi:MAG: aromatic amino acid transport family protein, partial [Candidatus Paceibacteria bacterium]
MFSRKFWQASALLAGTTIGSGILGVPYAIAQSGFLVGMAYIIGLGGAMLFLNLLFAHIVGHTKEVHQIPGYVSVYLGKFWRWLVIITLLGLGYGALTAYTLGAGNTLAELSGSPQWIMQWSFLILGAAIVGIGVRAVSKLEVLLIIGITVLILSVGCIAFQSSSFDTTRLLETGSSSALFLPYGVVFFAYLGFSSIPEL